MGFRFQKRIKLFPGITVNVSKSGLSTSVGTRGARVTLGNGKKRTTVGIPGTGLSHTNITSNTAQPAQSNGIGIGSIVVIGLVLLAVIALVMR